MKSRLCSTIATAFVLVTLAVPTRPTLAAAEDCTWSVAPDAVKVEWTAFKFTNKTGVTGTFTTSTLSGPRSADSLVGLAKGLQMTIDGASIESNNPARNVTIRDFFFAKFVPDPKIRGRATAASGDDHRGTIEIEITLNGVSRTVPFAYAIGRDNQVEATASIDLLDFQLDAAHASIHETCQQQHTGEDGVSKTWTTVGIALRGKFTKTCRVSAS